MPVIGFLNAAIARRVCGPSARLSPGPQGDRLYRGRERGDRISLGRESIRSAAGAGGRSGSPAGRRDRRVRQPSSALAAKAATTTIPIVFAVGEDPVRLGLVASLARPGGNLTGVNFFTGELVTKRLELLRELVPGGHARGRAASTRPSHEHRDARCETWKRLPAPWGCKSRSSTPAPAARSMRPLQLFARERPDALFVGGDAFFTSRRVQLAQLAARHAIPATYAVARLSPKSAG